MALDPDIHEFIISCRDFPVGKWLRSPPDERPPRTPQAISDYLNKEKFPTASGEGKWHPGTVWNIMWPNKEYFPPKPNDKILPHLDDSPKTVSQLADEAGMTEAAVRISLSSLLKFEMAKCIVASRKGRIGTLPHTYVRA